MKLGSSDVGPLDARYKHLLAVLRRRVCPFAQCAIVVVGRPVRMDEVVRVIVPDIGTSRRCFIYQRGLIPPHMGSGLAILRVEPSNRAGNNRYRTGRWKELWLDAR